MPDKSKTSLTEKNLHPRNRHRARYDFDTLIKCYPDLKRFIVLDGIKGGSIDFADAEAVKALNKALLICFYGVTAWDIPTGYLCPPVPGRADYLHYIADLLAEANGGAIPKKTTVLDVGVGANCIYPIIGRSEYGWDFVGSDVDRVAVKSSSQIITANNLLNAHVEIRWQNNRQNILNGIISGGDLFDVTMCNPPFHASAEHAKQGSVRKSKNVIKHFDDKPVLNFGGQPTELIYTGGEQDFIRRMIEESALFTKQSLWFSTLVSKKESLPGVYHHLRRASPVEFRTINMAQGNKVSRLVAWTFLTADDRAKWALKRWK